MITSTLAQVRARCHQATSHFMSHCLPSCVLPYGVHMQSKSDYFWFSVDDMTLIQVMWGRTGGSGPPTPGVQPPYPRPFFPPYPRPIFILIFFRVPLPKIQIFCPRPSDPRPFFVKRPPTPVPLTPGPRPLSSPTIMAWWCQATSHYLSQSQSSHLGDFVQQKMTRLTLMFLMMPYRHAELSWGFSNMYSHFCMMSWKFCLADDQIHNGASLHVASPIISIPFLMMPYRHAEYDGILPKGPYLPFISMALLAGYHRIVIRIVKYVFTFCIMSWRFRSTEDDQIYNGVTVLSIIYAVTIIPDDAPAT